MLEGIRQVFWPDQVEMEMADERGEAMQTYERRGDGAVGQSREGTESVGGGESLLAACEGEMNV